MKRSRNANIVIAIGVLLIVQISCMGEIMEQQMCEMSGYVWVESEIDPETGIEYDGYCYQPSQGEGQSGVSTPGEQNVPSQETAGVQGDPPQAGEPTLQDCLVPETGYQWGYENVERDDQSGESHGGRCQANFVVTNTSNEPIVVMVYDVFDNNAMDTNYWKQWFLAPGESRNKQSAYTWRPDDKDGDTFSYIGKVMVLRNTNDCLWLTGKDQEAFWEANSIDIPAPCH